MLIEVSLKQLLRPTQRRGISGLDGDAHKTITNNWQGSYMYMLHTVILLDASAATRLKSTFLRIGADINPGERATWVQMLGDCQTIFPGTKKDLLYLVVDIVKFLLGIRVLRSGCVS